MTRRALVALFSALVIAALLWPRAPVVVVEPDRSLQAVLDYAAPGQVVVLTPGIHRGPIVIDSRVELRGEPGAVLVAPRAAASVLNVAADGTRISGLRVEGGDTGILVREVEGVTIDQVEVSEAVLHGIEVVAASARITSSTIDRLVHPMAQGIEVRNSDGRPDTIIEDVKVVGGQEGIVSHVSEVALRDNEVIGTTLRGITVTEMSDGVVMGNAVRDATGTGFYCGDMSRCAFTGNSAPDIAAAVGGRSAAGWGLVVTYHSSAWSHDNDFGGVAGPLMISMGSLMRARSPLDPASPTALLAPLGIAGVIALAAATLGYGTGRIFLRRATVAAPLLGATGGMVAFGLALIVQTFHMVEHYLQVYRIHVDHIPSRGGLLGPTVETEWVHLTYNGALLILLILVLLGLRGMTRDARVGLVGGAVLIQGWHALEHVAKITQHITTGAKVNPGLIGGYLDLVWFHFTINLVVYGLCMAAALLWMRAYRRARAPLTYQPVAA